MLEGLEPSISLTGGPWYTDNELDTEFIHNLTEACYKLICDIVGFPFFLLLNVYLTSFLSVRAFLNAAVIPIDRFIQYPTHPNTLLPNKLEIR